MQEWTEAESLLRTWLDRARAARNGHRIAAKHYAKRHWLFGSAVVLMSAATGTAIGASLEQTSVGRWVVAVMAAAVALLAALQTFRKFDEIAQRHENARAGYACVCRDIEQVLALVQSDRGQPDEVLTRVRARLDDLANLNTPIPERFWQHAQQETGDARGAGS